MERDASLAHLPFNTVCHAQLRSGMVRLRMERDRYRTERYGWGRMGR